LDAVTHDGRPSDIYNIVTVLSVFKSCVRACLHSFWWCPGTG
jgi:hypothetical protein